MKTIKRILIAAFVTGIMGFNFYNNAQGKSYPSTSALSNIKTLQSCASEAYCNPITMNVCQITQGNVQLTGFGQPVVTW